MITPPWPDPVLQHAAESLAAGHPEPAYACLGDGVTDPDRREFYADVLGKIGERHVRMLEANANAAPGDPARWLLAGAALCFAAWSARGTNTMAYTSDEQVRGLFELSRTARARLHRAAELAPADPVPWTILQSIAKAAPAGRTEPAEVWDRLDALAPESFAGNYQRLTVLCRKWYGSTDEMLRFAQQRSGRQPDGHPLWSLVPKAWIEVWCDSWMFGNMLKRAYCLIRKPALRSRAARAQVDAASERILATDAYAGHPWYQAAHQMFGAYYVNAGQTGRARPHLERGGTRAARWAWDLFGTDDDEQAELMKARQAAGI
ncbi:hypothetical protein AB0G04_11910 [Actinoplanes sp. NPDC023801]|uniref:hypothetical protein n=1 Tax=Actinoplanes sp. NPDC023801 TaxID=3154595 RepID=UPI0033DFAFD5